MAARAEADRPAEPPEDRPAPRFPPAAYPVLGLLFGATLVWSFSRILLAVSHIAAAVIALLVSINILVGAALVAYGARVRRRPASFPLLVAAAVVVVGAGAAALGVGEEEGAGEEPRVHSVSVVAVDLEFDTSEIAVPAGSEVAIAFDNRDAGIQHNVAVFDGEDASAPVLFRGELITGPAQITYTFTAPPPGSYYFHCDVHPDMNGTLTAAEGPPGEGAPGEGGAAPPGEPGEGEQPGALQIVARDVAFVPAEATVSPIGGTVTILFENEDAVPHNVAVFDGSDASAPVVFRGEVFPGPARMEYAFPAPPPGTYFIHCDVHPVEMTGTLTVEG